MGGPVQGGRVYGQWPGLAPEQLYEERDLALTTDFRDVLSEAVYSIWVTARSHPFSRTMRRLPRSSGAS